MSGEAKGGTTGSLDRRSATTGSVDPRGATTDADGRPLPWIEALRLVLLAWYARNKRELPWRDVDDPYAVWVSEVMLQQTRVATAERYFDAWMARFPDVQALATSGLDEVLGIWQGLGYYRRARNLHAAASKIVVDNGGALPETVEGLLRLPGVGAYTAGAVASIAFGVRVPAVDGNARRVLARLLGEGGDPTRGETARRVESAAAALADCAQPGDVNQAIMELGARVCTPGSPACERCPIVPACAAHRDGRQTEIPAGPSRVKPRADHAVALALRGGGERLFVAKRRENALLGGLWELPIIPVEESIEPQTVCLAQLGLVATDLAACGTVEHVFTHIRLTAAVFHGRASGKDPTMDEVHGVGATPGEADASPWGPQVYETFRWVTRDELGGLPTSVLMDKIMRLVDASDAPGPSITRG